MARGGRRLGTPGKGYSNRTDLMQPQNRAPQSGANTAASAGQVAPPSPQGAQPAEAAFVDPTSRVPRLDDPTGRPGEPVTAGLFAGPGAGPEALGPLPPDPVNASIEAAYLAMPTPELRRVISRFRAKGAM